MDFKLILGYVLMYGTPSGASLAAAASMLPMLMVAVSVEDIGIGTAIVVMVIMSAAHHLVSNAATFACDIGAQLGMVVAVLHSREKRKAAYIVLALLAIWIMVSILYPLDHTWQTTTSVAWVMMILYTAVLWAVWPRHPERVSPLALPALLCLLGTAIIGNTVQNTTNFAWPCMHLFGAALLWALLGGEAYQVS